MDCKACLIPSETSLVAAGNATTPDAGRGGACQLASRRRVAADAAIGDVSPHIEFPLGLIEASPNARAGKGYQILGVFEVHWPVAAH